MVSHLSSAPLPNPNSSHHLAIVLRLCAAPAHPPPPHGRVIFGADRAVCGRRRRANPDSGGREGGCCSVSVDLGFDSIHRRDELLRRRRGQGRIVEPRSRRRVWIQQETQSEARHEDALPVGGPRADLHSSAVSDDDAGTRTRTRPSGWRYP